MSSKYLDMSPPVAAALKAGTPIVAIETGAFMQLPYPRNLTAMQEGEQAFWSRDCVPCFVALVDGRVKAGLTREEMDRLGQTGTACSRVDLPGLVAARGTAALRPSAALAAAKMAGIVPVASPSLGSAAADLDALCATGRLVFCSTLSHETRRLYAARAIPVLSGDPEALADAYQIQRDLEVAESSVVPCAASMADVARRASETAIALKRNTSYT